MLADFLNYFTGERSFPVSSVMCQRRHIAPAETTSDINSIEILEFFCTQYWDLPDDYIPPCLLCAFGGRPGETRTMSRLAPVFRRTTCSRRTWLRQVLHTCSSGATTCRLQPHAVSNIPTCSSIKQPRSWNFLFLLRIASSLVSICCLQITSFCRSFAALRLFVLNAFFW